MRLSFNPAQMNFCAKNRKQDEAAGGSGRRYLFPWEDGKNDSYGTAKTLHFDTPVHVKLPKPNHENLFLGPDYFVGRGAIKNTKEGAKTYIVSPDGTLKKAKDFKKQRLNPLYDKTFGFVHKKEKDAPKGQYGGFFEGWETPEFSSDQIDRMDSRLNSTNSGSKPSYQDLEFNLPPNSGTEWTANHTMPDEDGEE